MKLSFGLAIFFLSINLFPQDQVKQITFNDSMSSNVSFYYHPDGSYSIPYILYELFSGSSINIYNMYYESAADSFIALPPVTNNSFQNKNPVGIIQRDSQLVFYQTNKNGNWDIVYKYSTPSGWSDEIILLGSSEDEEKPKFLENFGEENFIPMLCRQGNKILFLEFTADTTTQEVVFSGEQYGQGNDFNVYYDMGTIYVITTESIGSENRVVYKKRDYYRSQWSDPIIVTGTGEYSNPIYYSNSIMAPPIVFYSKINDGQSRIYIHDLTSGEIILFDSLQQGNQSRLSIAPINEIFESIGNALNIFPFIYKVQVSDSVFVCMPQEQLSGTQKFYTKMEDILPGIGMVGFNERGIIYGIWEDSTENSIQLFGKSIHITFGDVSDNDFLNSCRLFQNYPNPFNPVTTISYSIKEYSKVVIKIFDILGNEIETFIEEEKPAGNYEVTWNASSLPSGVYFYQLRAVPFGRQAGAFVETKKMILMK